MQFNFAVTMPSLPSTLPAMPAQGGPKMRKMTTEDQVSFARPENKASKETVVFLSGARKT